MANWRVAYNLHGLEAFSVARIGKKLHLVARDNKTLCGRWVRPSEPRNRGVAWPQFSPVAKCQKCQQIWRTEEARGREGSD